MADLLSLALDNLLSPIILFFALGFAAALLRSDLAVPEAVGKAMALYLMLAIGFKGGVELSRQGLDWTTAALLAAGALLSFVIPLIAYGILRAHLFDIDLLGDQKTSHNFEAHIGATVFF